MATVVCSNSAYEINEALQARAKYKAILKLLKNNDFACEISISGVKIGICDNSELIPVIKSNIKEVNKFLKGKSNKWE